MVCIRFTRLLLGLLISLAAIGVCTADTHHGIRLLDNSDRLIAGDKKNLHGETATASGAGTKWPRGRKMGVEDVKEEVTVKTGKAKNSSKKSFGPSNIDEKDTSSTTLKSRTVGKKTNGGALEPLNLSNTPQLSSTPSTDHGSLGSPAGAKPPVPPTSHDPFQTADTQKLSDADTEIFNMLSKDYQTRAALRPPINNDLPLEDSDVEP